MMIHPSPPKIVEGKRIRLIARHNDQASEMFALVDKNRKSLGRWMPWEKETQSVADSLSYLELAQLWWTEGTTFDFSVFDKLNNKMVGSFGLHSINWIKKSCEIGYWLDEAYQGRGYISEAVLLGEEMALNLGFHRLVITCDRLNQRSQNIPRRLRYRLESLQIDECIDHHGQHRDTLRFVKLLNIKVDGHITENLPAGYSIQELDSEPFWKLVEEKKKYVFSDNLIPHGRSLLSDQEREKLKVLGEAFRRPYFYHAVLWCHSEVVGWTWGYQDSPESFYMVNSAVMPEHRGRGLYTRLLQGTVDKLVEKGFQRIWSRHTYTNNQIIIPKLKQGFQITGSELSDTFGSLIYLTYFSNPLRKKVLSFRSGESRPDDEIKKIFDL